MFLGVATWLIIVLIIVWALLDVLSRVGRALLEILLPIFNSKPIDLKSMFGEWAGMLLQNYNIFIFIEN